MKTILYKGHELKANKNNRILKPTKALYPYDAATGWQALNIARMLYFQKYKR